MYIFVSVLLLGETEEYHRHVDKRRKRILFVLLILVELLTNFLFLILPKNPQMAFCDINRDNTGGNPICLVCFINGVRSTGYIA